MKEYEEIESKSDKCEEDDMVQFDDFSDIEYLVNREALVIRRSIKDQIKYNVWSNNTTRKHPLY